MTRAGVAYRLRLAVTKEPLVLVLYCTVWVSLDDVLPLKLASPP